MNPVNRRPLAAVHLPGCLVQVVPDGSQMPQQWRCQCRQFSCAFISVVGMYRNEETLEPVPYFQKLVSNIDERMALIVDPMLATGGSVIATIDLLKKAGCSSIKVLVLVAAPEGIAALEKAHPDVELYTASIDQGLNEHGYIIPGLGDAGDKIFGTK